MGGHTCGANHMNTPSLKVKEKLLAAKNSIPTSARRTKKRPLESFSASEKTWVREMVKHKSHIQVANVKGTTLAVINKICKEK